MNVAVLADTHIPKRAKDLPQAAYEVLARAEAIIHAGDVLVQEFLTRLQQFAPVYAVQGNNDRELCLPTRLEITLEGVQIGVVHDSGKAKGRGRRLRRQFPEAQVVIFGHSHIAVNQYEDGLLLFNPGSATDRRRQPKHTMGMLVVRAGQIVSKIIELD